MWVILIATPALRVAPNLLHAAPRGRLPPPRLQQQGTSSYDPSAQQFDILSLRSYRRDTILQYDATNQSEPLRIALTLFGILFSLCIPTLFGDTQDATTTTVAAIAGTGISGTLFNRK